MDTSKELSSDDLVDLIIQALWGASAEEVARIFIDEQQQGEN